MGIYGNTSEDNSTQTITTLTEYEFSEDISDTEHLIFTCLMLIIISLGSLGNLVAFLVFQRKHLRKNVTTLYYRALVLLDIAILNIGLLPVIVKQLSDFDLLSTSMVSCRGLSWTLHFLIDFEAWVLVTVSICSFLSVTYPYQILSFWTKQKAWISFVGIAGLSLLLNIPTAFVYDITMDDKLCSQSQDRFVNAWIWLDAMLFSIIPLLILIPCNVGITWTLSKVDNIAQKHQTEKRFLTSMALVLLSLFLSFSILTTPRITVGLLTLSTPLHKRRADFCSSLLFHINYAIKFIIFRSLCPRFSQQFKECCCCAEQVNPSVYTV